MRTGIQLQEKTAVARRRALRLGRLFLGGLLLAGVVGCAVAPNAGRVPSAPTELAAPGRAMYEEARRLEARGEISRAIAAYLQAVNESPDEPVFLTGLGMAYLRGENPAAARPHLARAVRLDENNYRARQGYGYVLLNLGDEKRAVQQLEAALRLRATIQGKFLLAEAYEKTGSRQQAIALYREVAEADPSGKLGRAAAERMRDLVEM
ncbi:MAG: tetratricopeptide repeat protein [Desulfuromonadales bacterium]